MSTVLKVLSGHVMVDQLEVLAPAKVNLFLSIEGKRPDGYHELRSVFQKISLADRLVIVKRKGGISLSCPDSNLPEDRSNLVYLAAERFLKFTGIGSGVSISLYKKIPIAAGLGGGSSDAAAVLVGLNNLFGTGVDNEKLQELSKPLGADVPFFVAQNSAAMVTGIGHDIKSFPSLRNCWLVLANPGISVSTKWVYDNLTLTTGENTFKLTCSESSDTSFEAAGLSEVVAVCGAKSLFNDLESVTIERYGVIAELKSIMLDKGASLALMSGSGPTVFGVFAEKITAENCCTYLQERCEKVFFTSPLTS